MLGFDVTFWKEMMAINHTIDLLYLLEFESWILYEYLCYELFFTELYFITTFVFFCTEICVVLCYSKLLIWVTKERKQHNVGVFVPEILCKCFRTSNYKQQDGI